MLVNLTKDEIRVILAEMHRSYTFKNHPDVTPLFEKLQGIYDACTCKEQNED